MSDVVFQTVPSINAWCQNQGELEFTRQAVYQKIRRIEPGVAAGLVQYSAQKARVTINALRRPKPILADYRIRILDGNHLPGTEHRLKPLRPHNAAALPGQSLVLYDPQEDLITDVIPCEDAYTQERALLAGVLELLQARDCLIADRNFCTAAFLVRTHARDAFFVIRQHSTMKCQPLGKARGAGKDEQGRELLEQKIEVVDPDSGQVLHARCITIMPKKRGQLKLQVLTNLPANKISARQVGDLYRGRWRIENAFQRLQENLHSEINTLAYPKAALFGFCLGCVAYNVLTIVKSGLAAIHGDAYVETMSMYYLTLEVARISPGMAIVLPDAQWAVFAKMDENAFHETLLALAKELNPKKYTTQKRGPKKPAPQKISGKRNRHVSTARVLNAQT